MRDLVQVGTVVAVDGKRITVRFQGKKTTAALTALDNTSILESGIRYTEYESGGSGDAEFENHRHKIPKWVPPIGARVVCLMKDDGDGQGFVIGTI